MFAHQSIKRCHKTIHEHMVKFHTEWKPMCTVGILRQYRIQAKQTGLRKASTSGIWVPSFRHYHLPLDQQFSNYLVFRPLLLQKWLRIPKNSVDFCRLYLTFVGFCRLYLTFTVLEIKTEKFYKYLLIQLKIITSKKFI